MANRFIFSDPSVAFVLRDGGPNQDFDGIADELFPEFGNVILGIGRDIPFQSLGESRSIAEFDISAVPTLLDGNITQATFEVRVSSALIGDLGGLDEVSISLSVYGYVGNGIAESSDFGAGTLLDTLDIMGVTRGEILSFDITTFIDTALANSDSFAGLAVRVNDVGGIFIREFNEFPQLRIQTDGTSDPILLSNPEVDFQVIDGGASGEFDGLGDPEKVFSTFNGVVLDAPRDLVAIFPEVGEERSIVEFDISSFTVPDGEAIAEAHLELEVSNPQVSGLGQDGSNVLNELSLYGYIGNGNADLTDFDAGTFIDNIDLSSVMVGDRLSIEVTSLVRSFVRDSESFVGFGIRTDEVGGISLSGASTLDAPSLVIRTEEPTSTNYRVTNINDSGEGSLRQAILDANSFVGADTISFDASLAGQTITLGGSELLIKDDLLIDGDIDNDGVADITIDANQQSRVLNIDDGETVNKTVTLDGLTITGGFFERTQRNQAFEGAGIRSKENLTLTNSTIIGNRIETGQYTVDRYGSQYQRDFLGSSLGGGIFSSGGNLTITRSTISGNSVDGGYIPPFLVGDSPSFGGSNGGGIFSEDGNLTIVESKISGNSTRFGRQSRGGGVYSRNGSATVDRSTLSDNFSGTGGGGIDSDNLVLTSSTVSGNRALGFTDATGGGVRADNLTVRNSTIVDNSVATSFDSFVRPEIAIGGGIAGRTIELYNSIVAGNRGQGGEGIYSGNRYNDISIGYIGLGQVARSRVITGANNLIGDGDSLAVDTDTDLIDGVNGNQIGTEATPIDPKLGPLQDNGGPTFTHALLEDSPAINAGSNALIPDGTITDQRGEARIVGGTVDIGAYESDVTDPGEPDTVPTVENPILDQVAQVAQSYRFELPDDIFDDVDGDVLTTSASLENGQPLPNWLSFNAGTETLQGMPQNSDVGTVAIAITATDDDGNQVTDIFDLTVEGIKPPSLNEINGDDRNNRLDGTATADLMRGFGRKDRLRGFEGDDQLFGDEGNDTLDGNAGNDQAFGGTGKDRISGGLGDDELFGEEGGDRLFGNDGNDKLSGGDGNDSLNGDNGDDVLIGGAGRNQLRGGQGSDGFVLEVGSGFSQVKDFQLGEDHILLPKGLVFGDLTITQAKRKSQILVGDDLALEVFNVNASSLDAGTFKSF